MAGKHGGARPGAGRKKGSRDNVAKKHQATLAELARSHTEAAIAALVDVMRTGSDSARVVAANSILDRGHGKPIQATVEVDPEKVDLPFDGWAIKRAKPD